MLGTTARVYPATAQERTRSDSREKASTSSDVSTAQERTRVKGDVAVREERERKERKEQKRYTAKQRKAYGRLIHARMHHGHSSNVMSALKKAYEDRFPYKKGNMTMIVFMWMVMSMAM